MPAIITHHQFAQEALALPTMSFIRTEAERNAFALGNQGPDPLFFCAISPSLAPYKRSGGIMHGSSPAALLHAISESASNAPSNRRDVVRAYSAGFLCHYLLDRAAHPFIYAQQYALCNAGIEGLEMRDGHDVHAVIETELDELILFTHTEQTIATFEPHKKILQLDDQTLAAISHAICGVFWKAYERPIPADLFSVGVRNYRFVERAIYSPRGTKSALFGMMERRFKRHSFAQAFSPRSCARTQSAFGNHEHAIWIDPFTNSESTTSFEDIFQATLQEADALIAPFIEDGFSIEEARKLTHGLNFSGKPVA